MNFSRGCTFLLQRICVLLVVLAISSFGCTSQKPSPAEVTTTGPIPKVEVDNALHEFGVMEVGEEKEHLFKITNTGEGLLRLTPGKATCKCTSFTVDKHELKKGEVAIATVRWRPIEEQENFRQSAPIETNDPDTPTIQLNIKGEVKSIYTLKPGVLWVIGEFAEGEVKKYDGMIYSAIEEKFEIQKLEVTFPGIVVALEPMSDVELKKESAKSGYHIKLTSTEQMPVGQFREHIRFVCHGTKDVDMVVNIQGERPGPFRVLGKGFHQKTWTWDIGTFEAKTGFKQSLNLFYTGEADLKLDDVEGTPSENRMTLVRDDKFKGRGHRYILEVEIPPSDRAQIYNEGKPAKIKAKLNAPEMKTLTLQLRYNALVK